MCVYRESTLIHDTHDLESGRGCVRWHSVFLCVMMKCCHEHSNVCSQYVERLQGICVFNTGEQCSEH